MKTRFLICYALFISSCASFPVPESIMPANCKDVRNGLGPLSSIVFNPTVHGKPYSDTSNEKFVEMSTQHIKFTNCFESDNPKNSSNFQNKFIFRFSKNIENGDLSLPLAVSLLTIGILPAWSKITSELQIIKVDKFQLEEEVFKIKNERYQIVSILISPVGIYRSITAPKGLNANESTQLETNNYLVDNAIAEIVKKGFLDPK